MSIIRPVPAEYFRMIRKAFPKADEVITSRNFEVIDYTSRLADGRGRDYHESLDAVDKLRRLQARAKANDDKAEAYGVEKFQSKQQRDERLEFYRKSWKKLPMRIIKDKFETTGTGSVGYYPDYLFINGKSQVKVKVVDETTLALRSTHTSSKSLLERLMATDEVVNLLKACEDPATEKLTIHNDEDLRDLREAAQLAVLQGKPQLVARFMTLTGKLPSVTQQNKLINLATSQKDKQTLKNLFMDESLGRFRDPALPSLQGRDLAKTLARMSSGGIPKDKELAIFLKNSANFARVEKWTDPPAWKEYLASLQDAEKR